MAADDESSGVTPATDGARAVSEAHATTARDGEPSPARRAADPVVPEGDQERTDVGWGGSADTELSRDAELIADRPPHYDR